MTLNLNNHLLETPDGLITALLWHLLFEIFPGMTGSVAEAVLGLVGHIGRGAVFKRVDPSRGTAPSIHAGGGAMLGIVSSKPSGITRVASATRMSILGSVTSRIAKILAIERLLLVELSLGLILDILPGEIGNVMPGVIISRAINLI